MSILIVTQQMKTNRSKSKIKKLSMANAGLFFAILLFKQKQKKSSLFFI